MNHIKTGYKGEKIAVNFLLSKGYQILETNWRFHHKEIDIIAKSANNELVIVEVKTRKSNRFGTPEEAVDEKKQAFLIDAADAYIEENKLNLEVRYDIIAIDISLEEYKINHIQEAFYPNF